MYFIFVVWLISGSIFLAALAGAKLGDLRHTDLRRFRIWNTLLVTAYLLSYLAVLRIRHSATHQRQESCRVIPIAEGSDWTARVTPDYPEQAKSLLIQGRVIATVTIDPAGSVVRVDVLSGKPILADIVKSALLRWRYKAVDSVKNRILSLTTEFYCE